jgi:hypothetical protein
MKKLLNLFMFAMVALGTTFSAAQALAYPEDIYGSWRTEYPITQDPYVYSTGEIFFSDRSIWFQATCTYTNGPTLTAQVEAPIQIGPNFFNILENRYNESRFGRIGCVANLSAGPVEYQVYGPDRMVIFNRNTGWRMDLVR